jgi:predicted O-linked N-acetylglucosamine transferase (SPINDLY family)
LAGRYPSEERLLYERFAKTFPDVLDRVVFLPRMKMSDFLCLVRSADVVLDPVYFSGGNSTAETFALGVPIVTWPDKFLRDRVTYSFYKTMGISELIAENASQYVSLANRLATDHEFHAQMSKSIKDNADRFFENIQVVRELECFMEAAIEARRKGADSVHWDGQVITTP